MLRDPKDRPLSRVEMTMPDGEVRVFEQTLADIERDGKAEVGDPNAVSDAFDRAWLHHQKVGGKHHWQYWILPLDDGGFRALEMPDRYRREMVADWRGAGKAITGTDDVLPWYAANRDRMILHDNTRAWVEGTIGFPATPKGENDE